MVKLSIIILSYNTKDLIATCVESLDKQYKEQLEKGIFEIIVVDNNSTDGTRESIKGIKSIFFIQNRQNYGFSKGNNIGARQVKGQYILFLNSDTKIEDGGLLKMVDFMDKDQLIGVLGGKLINTDMTNQPSVGTFYHLLQTLLMLLGAERKGLLRESPKRQTEVDWVSGAALMIRSDIFKKLSGFDEGFFMYMEDMELCFRVKNLGRKIYFFPDVTIMHQNQGSSNRSFAVVQIYKGLLYFYKKHKSSWEYNIVKAALLLKATLAIGIGMLTKNNYLTTTYKQAFTVSL